MSPAHRPPVMHFEKVDLSCAKAQFFENGNHRGTLLLPFSGRNSGKTLCIIGQNPSTANEKYADQTIRFLEELIYRNCPQYSALLILNLYSRIDTNKTATGLPLNTDCARLFDEAINNHEDFLLVYGQLKNEGIYRFPERAAEVAIRLSGKTLFKLDIETNYPPHPGNPKICYNNFDVQLVQMNSS